MIDATTQELIATIRRSSDGMLFTPVYSNPGITNVPFPSFANLKTAKEVLERDYRRLVEHLANTDSL